MMVLISLLFFVTGFAALVYQNVWLRDLGLIFGNTVHAAATVVTAYMLGLAVGAKIAGWLSPRIRRPVFVFGTLSGALGLYAFIVPLMFSVLRLTYRFAFREVSTSAWFLLALRFVMSVGFLAIPTMLMGATLPVLCKGLAADRRRYSLKVSLLYGINTLGAVAGVVLSGFVLIPRIGVRNSATLAAVANFAVMLAAWMLSARSHPVENAPQDTKDASSCRAEAAVGVQPTPTSVWWPLAGACLSGVVALGLEVAWFRLLIHVFGSTTYSYSTMLGIYLAGLALGSLLLGWLGDRQGSPLWLFGVALGVAGFYAVFTLLLFPEMPEFLLRGLIDWGMEWHSLQTAKVLIAALFIFIPALMFGFAFPLGTKAIRAATGQTGSSAVANSYLADTVGAAFGASVTGFFILPLLGMQSTLLLLGLAGALLGAVFAIRFAGSARSRAVAAALFVALALLAVVTHKPWDPRIIASGAYFSPWNHIANGRPILRQKLRSQRLLYFREGLTSTVSVIKGADEHLAYSALGKVQADESPRSMALQRMQGHLPMLLHPNPKRVLNIGLGAGVTFGALGCYPTEHLEVIEIEPAVSYVAAAWGDRNHRIMERDDAILTINDGRNHLFATDEKYDVITSDPFEPVMAGAAHVYTLEHFVQARDRLNPGGIMAQYLPLYELSKEDFLTIARTFARAFPESLIFFTGFDTVMLGFRDGMDVCLATIEQKYEHEAVRQSLAEIGYPLPEQILSMLIGPLSGLADMESGEINTDDNLVITFRAPFSTLHYWADVNQEVLLNLFRPIPERYYANLPQDRVDALLRSHSALESALRASVSRGRGKMGESIELLMSAVTNAPHSAVIRNELSDALLMSANSMRQAGVLDQAFMQYQMSLSFNPGEVAATVALVDMAMSIRRVQNAKEWLEAGLSRHPDSPLFLALKGKIIGLADGNLAEGIQYIERALSMLPERSDMWRDLHHLAALAGDAERVRLSKLSLERLGVSLEEITP